jgi:hypothetical protein
MRIGLFTMTLTLACTSRPLAQDDEAGTTTNPGSTDGEAIDEASEATSASRGTSADADESTTVGPEPDVPAWDDCDPFEQDCPQGEKCVPFALRGESYYGDHKCVPVLGDQAPGEPCTWGGMVEATDDCVAGSICWNVSPDAYECVAQCMGSADMPFCQDGLSCEFYASESDIFLCIDPCDPVVQDCDEGLGCYWANTDFNCIFTAEDIPTGEPCGYLNDCAAGHLCADAAVLPDCAGSACCTQWCNLPDGDAGCVAQPGTVCAAFFEMGMVPAGYEHVGVCVLPP